LGQYTRWGVFVKKLQKSSNGYNMGHYSRWGCCKKKLQNPPSQPTTLNRAIGHRPSPGPA